MAYTFMTAGQFINKTPKQDYIDLVQETLDDQFYNSSDVFTIQEETALASGVYQNVDVRVNNVVNAGVGNNAEVDFKKLLFKDLGHETQMGWMYKFDNNYWVAINIDTIKTLAQTVIVKRCNNMLRWMDDLGIIYEEPCSLGYLIMENRDYSTAGSALVVPSGMIDCSAQLNPRTNKIKPNQRFLFGNPNNWTAYRVEGGGINNYNNRTTATNYDTGLLKLSLAVDYANPQTDDYTRGIANVGENVYQLTLNQSTISGGVGQTVQLQATTTLNGEVVSRTLVWSSSNPAYATVNSTGLVTFVATGSTTITCAISGNTLVNDTCTATVGGSPVDNYQVIFSPDRNTILEESTQSWDVYLYKNGVQEADVFTFSLDPNTVPSANYFYNTSGGNSFSIQNLKRFTADTLDVTATSGIYSATIKVTLLGAW
jgi:hypothetical protein